MKSTANRAVSLPHIHVLVLDDDPASRVRIHHALRVMGVGHVTEVGSDGAGKSMASLKSVDSIVCDLGLGMGSGLGLLKAIRLGRVPGIRADVPFVFVTDLAHPRIVTAAEQLDVGGFVIRPLTTDRLRTVMMKSLQHPVVLAPETYLNVDVAEALRLPDVTDPDDRAARPLGADQVSDRARF